MKFLTVFTLVLSLISFSSLASQCPDILKGEQRLLNSTDTVNLCNEFKGQTLLVVNTASQCGFTSQFDDLEKLYQQYKDQNFVVVGFPSNDFRQDKGTEEQTAKVCYLDYGVTFPMMARSSVKGSGANPVFEKISKQAGVEPRWNFYKFLVNKNGEVVATFPSSTNPMDSKLRSVIEQQL
jgi:glutathione peroxidase